LVAEGTAVRAEWIVDPVRREGAAFSKRIGRRLRLERIGAGLPRYSAWIVTGEKNKETSKQEFPTAPPVYSAAYSSMKKHGKRVRNDVEDVPL
jgi:hypothetical protein